MFEFDPGTTNSDDEQVASQTAEWDEQPEEDKCPPVIGLHRVNRRDGGGRCRVSGDGVFATTEPLPDRRDGVLHKLLGLISTNTIHNGQPYFLCVYCSQI